MISKKKLTDKEAIDLAVDYAKKKMDMSIDKSEYEEIYVSKISDSEWKVAFVSSVSKSFYFILDPKKRAVLSYDEGV